MTSTLYRRQTGLNTCKDWPRNNCMTWKTNGGTRRQRKCRNMLTLITTNSCLKLWKLFRGLHSPPVCCQHIGSKVMKNQERLKNRLAEHCHTLLNRLSLPWPWTKSHNKWPWTSWIKHLWPTKAIKQMNSDRAPGKDAIPVEIYKAS